MSRDGRWKEIIEVCVGTKGRESANGEMDQLLQGRSTAGDQGCGSDSAESLGTDAVGMLGVGYENPDPVRSKG